MAHSRAGSVSASSVAADVAAELGPGRVLAVHRRACTLEMTAGGLLTLAHPALGNGPATILVPRLAWSAGTAFWPDGPQHLRFAHGPALDWSAAQVWNAAASAPVGILTRHNVDLLTAMLIDYKINAGLLPVVLVQPATSAIQQALATKAAPLLHALPDPAAVRGLIGLGPGLTPAGDDLLAGLMLILHYADHPVAASLRQALADPATTRLSRAMLAWAAQGLAGEQRLDLLRGLFSPPATQMQPLVQCVLTHGATSGADWLAGVLLGLRMIEPDPL